MTPVLLHGDPGTDQVNNASASARRAERNVVLLVLASLLVSTTPQNAHARFQDDALQRALRATVAVETTRINGTQTGSGFVVTAEGVLVTSASLLKGAMSAKVIFESGEEYPVIGMVTFDESRDLAVLRIAGFRLPTVSLLDSDSVEIGQQVLSLTAVSGNAATLSDGRVQGIQLVGSVPVLRTTLVGSSEALGAPILTEGGRLIGMTGSLGATDGSERIALPSNELAEAITTANAQVPTELADWEWDENASGTLEGRIAFASGRHGSLDLFVMNADGSDQRRLTYAPGHETEPAWSPDGSKIAFMAQEEGDDNWDIFVMDVDGSDLLQLTRHGRNDTSPTWSPDGRTIAFGSSRENAWQIYLIDVDGTNVRALTDKAVQSSYPSWSPGGMRIAYHATPNAEMTRDIQVINVQGGQPQRLTTHTAEEWLPEWSPDGQKIAFWSLRDGSWEIYLMNTDGSDERKLTEESAGVPRTAGVSRPTWSADGAFIAFASSRTGNIDIWLMNADGTNHRRLTNSAAQDIDPDWFTIR